MASIVCLCRLNQSSASISIGTTEKDNLGSGFYTVYLKICLLKEMLGLFFMIPEEETRAHRKYGGKIIASVENITF